MEKKKKTYFLPPLQSRHLRFSLSALLFLYQNSHIQRLCVIGTIKNVEKKQGKITIILQLYIGKRGVKTTKCQSVFLESYPLFCLVPAAVKATCRRAASQFLLWTEGSGKRRKGNENPICLYSANYYRFSPCLKKMAD